MNSLQISTTLFLPVHFNIVIPFKYRFVKQLFPLRFCELNHYDQMTTDALFEKQLWAELGQMVRSKKRT